MRRTLAGVLVAVTAALAACSGGSETTTPSAKPSEIDRDAWTQELMAAGARSDPDLDALEDVTRRVCANDVDQLALMLSLADAQPELLRIDMEYVCPAEVHKIDEALEQLESDTSEVQDACDTPPEARTEEQQLMAEAMACD